MIKTDVKVGTLDAFFEEGRRIAQKADAGLPLPEVHSITFENLGDMLKYLTPKRVALFEAIKASAARGQGWHDVQKRVALFEAIKASAGPESITTVAHRVGRDRAAVKRDIDALCRLGIVDVEDVPLPGHGRQKLVRPVAQRVVLSATI